MFLNYQLPPLASFAEARTRSFAEIAAGIHVSLEEDCGEISVDLQESLKIRFSDISPEARWVEMGFQLADERWKTCSRLVLRIEARGRGEEMRVNPALRIGRKGAFHDRFATGKLDFGPERSSRSIDFDLSPKDMNEAESLALFLFFDSADNELELSDLSVCGFA